MTDLVNNLGGPDGFGTSNLGRNDDGFTGRIDLTSVFGSQGINFFGHYYTGLYINNNGSLTFNSGTSAFTPTAITGSTSNPIIAPYWADVDTRGGAVSPTPGGTSTGSNLVWWALDSTTHTFTATWDDVGYYGSHTDKL
ncbi:MAG TPA: nidogen-like domain-containing protein, partial [Reyranella sp.]|nr:nidogen-like domain-containing protein [Reyranella sp.]